jgi:hypothetical protein
MERIAGGFPMKTIRDWLSIHWLAVKYFLAGDTWPEAVDFARAIVLGFSKP